MAWFHASCCGDRNPGQRGSPPHAPRRSGAGLRWDRLGMPHHGRENNPTDCPIAAPGASRPAGTERRTIASAARCSSWAWSSSSEEQSSGCSPRCSPRRSSWPGSGSGPGSSCGPGVCCTDSWGGSAASGSASGTAHEMDHADGARSTERCCGVLGEPRVRTPVAAREHRLQGQPPVRRLPLGRI